MSLTDTARWPPFLSMPDFPDPHYWVLLGDITSVERFTRLVLRCKDRDGEQFTVAFYPEDDGDTPDQLKGVRKGSTVAIKTPSEHHFLDGSRGVRQESVKGDVHIFQVPLTRVITLGNEIATMTEARKAAPQRICAACDKQGEGFQLCGRCKWVHYCSKDCQKSDWEERGHKKDCRVYEELPGLMRFVD